MKTEKICETIKKDSVETVYVNISYPSLDGINQFEKRFNMYYMSVAKKFRDFAVLKLAVNAEKELSRNESFVKYGASMQCHVSFENDEYISIVADITVFDGKRAKRARRCSVWEKSSGMIASLSDFLRLTGECKKLLYKKIEDIYRINIKNAVFADDFVDTERLLKRAVDLENFYLVPNGFAFFVKCELLSFSNVTPPSFVIPYHLTENFNKIKL